MHVARRQLQQRPLAGAGGSVVRRAVSTGSSSSSSSSSRRALRLARAPRASGSEHEQETREDSAARLTALLGQEPEQPAPDSGLQPWWSLKPSQASAPRQKLMHAPGEVARFVADSPVYATKVRSGRSTKLGGELDIPQVEPYFCYLIMAAQLAVYAAGTGLAVVEGPSAAGSWALALAMEPAAAASGESWRLLTAMLLHGGITHLALDTLFLGFFSPGIEALLGHGVFCSTYALSGLAGATAVLLVSESPDPVSTATAATIGLVGAMVGYELRNLAIVRQSLASRRSKAEDGKQGSSTLRKPWGAVGLVALMVALGFLPGSMVDNTAHVGGLLAGLGLGYYTGPSFTLIQEVDIPLGSMSVPEQAAQTVVVLDRRSGLDKGLAAAGALALLGGALALGAAARAGLGA